MPDIADHNQDREQDIAFPDINFDEFVFPDIHFDHPNWGQEATNVDQSRRNQDITTPTIDPVLLSESSDVPLPTTEPHTPVSSSSGLVSARVGISAQEDLYRGSQQYHRSLWTDRYKEYLQHFGWPSDRSQRFGNRDFESEMPSTGRSSGSHHQLETQRKANVASLQCQHQGTAASRDQMEYLQVIDPSFDARRQDFLCDGDIRPAETISFNGDEAEFQEDYRRDRYLRMSPGACYRQLQALQYAPPVIQSQSPYFNCDFQYSCTPHNPQLCSSTPTPSFGRPPAFSASPVFSGTNLAAEYPSVSLELSSAPFDPSFSSPQRLSYTPPSPVARKESVQCTSCGKNFKKSLLPDLCSRCAQKHLRHTARPQLFIIDASVPDLVAARAKVYAPLAARGPPIRDLAAVLRDEDAYVQKFLDAVNVVVEGGEHGNHLLPSLSWEQRQQVILNQNARMLETYSSACITARMRALFAEIVAYHAGSRETFYATGGDNFGYGDNAKLEFEQRVEEVCGYMRVNKRIVMDVVEGRGVQALVGNPKAYDKRKGSNNECNVVKKKRMDLGKMNESEVEEDGVGSGGGRKGLGKRRRVLSAIDEESKK